MFRLNTCLNGNSCLNRNCLNKAAMVTVFETNTASCGDFNETRSRPHFEDSTVLRIWPTPTSLGPCSTQAGRMCFTTLSRPHCRRTKRFSTGPTNNSQVLDLLIPGSSDRVYAHARIYGNGVPVRVAIDPSGATDVHAWISINGGMVPSAVKVKYLLAKTVVQKGNYTWAGQTFGANFESDGRLMSDEVIESFPCDQEKACTVRVPAPGFALVYLTDSVYSVGPANHLLKYLKFTSVYVSVIQPKDNQFLSYRKSMRISTPLMK
ncbi:hypothetical protein C8J57DRAFT_1628993 [Mycena rebaudengoi]|nr:hypothetical protein C8J57DRAFT_1628993 [Mycena rebaudengoi]